jgi:hypothetical protein
MKPSKREVYELAVRLAKSGRMKNWKSIQAQLVKDGHKRAPDLLDGDKIRAVLDICCSDSRSKGGHA